MILVIQSLKDFIESTDKKIYLNLINYHICTKQAKISRKVNGLPSLPSCIK